MKNTPSRHLRTYSVALLSTLALCGSSLGATISIGDVVTGEFGVTSSAPALSSSPTVVDPGIEFTFAGGRSTLDLREDAFDITYDFLGLTGGIGAPTTWSLTDLFDIQGVTLTSGNAASIADISFTMNSISVDFIDLPNPPEFHSFSFAVEGTPVVDPPDNAIPEPSGILTLAFLLSGGAFIRRRGSKAC